MLVSLEHIEKMKLQLCGGKTYPAEVQAIRLGLDPSFLRGLRVLDVDWGRGLLY